MQEGDFRSQAARAAKTVIGEQSAARRVDEFSRRRRSPLKPGATRPASPPAPSTRPWRDDFDEFYSTAGGSRESEGITELRELFRRLGRWTPFPNAEITAPIPRRGATTAGAPRESTVFLSAQAARPDRTHQYGDESPSVRGGFHKSR